MGRVYIRVAAEVDVDVWEVIDQIDTDDLRTELESRHKQQPETGPHIMQIYEAMAMGNRERAWELMRLYVQETVGRLLP